MRTLGIDLGTRRIGLALSDEGGRFATPLDVLEVSGVEQAIEPIVKLILKESITRVVVGLPLNMDDSIGPAVKATIEWAGDLSRQIGKRVIFVDERLSSFAAAAQNFARAERCALNCRRRSRFAVKSISMLYTACESRVRAFWR